MKGLLMSPVSVLVVCGLLLPSFVYSLGLTYSTASEILIYAIAGLGLNLLLGYTGLVSFGHGIFFGVAAYAASIIQVQLMPGYIFIPMVLAVAITPAPEPELISPTRKCTFLLSISFWAFVGAMADPTLSSVNRSTSRPKIPPAAFSSSTARFTPLNP